MTAKAYTATSTYDWALKPPNTGLICAINGQAVWCSQICLVVALVLFLTGVNIKKVQGRTLKQL